MSVNATQQKPYLKWLKKIGFWGFVFFLIKGLAWLALAFWLSK